MIEENAIPEPKLTAGDVRSIRREAFAGGRSAAEMAAHYGVTTWTIYEIIRFRSWKHLR